MKKHLNPGPLTQMGPEALLAWQYLSLRQEKSVLEDPAADYGDLLETLEAQDLLSVIRRAKEILLKKGWTLPEAADTGERLVITKDFRIHLNGTDGPEIRMRPMTKAVFLLFLRHPEGIDLKRIDDHAEELKALYRKTSTRSDSEAVERAVGKILNAESRETNVAAARISAALSGHISSDRLPEYVVSGRYGSRKSIKLDRRLVEWL